MYRSSGVASSLARTRSTASGERHIRWCGRFVRAGGRQRPRGRRGGSRPISEREGSPSTDSSVARAATEAVRSGWFSPVCQELSVLTLAGVPRARSCRDSAARLCPLPATAARSAVLNSLVIVRGCYRRELRRSIPEFHTELSGFDPLADSPPSPSPDEIGPGHYEEAEHAQQTKTLRRHCGRRALNRVA